jgi:hypothetical protein
MPTSKWYQRQLFVKVGQLQVILTVEEKVLVAEYRRAEARGT